MILSPRKLPFCLPWLWIPQLHLASPGGYPCCCRQPCPCGKSPADDYLVTLAGIVENYVSTCGSCYSLNDDFIVSRGTSLPGQPPETCQPCTKGWCCWYYEFSPTICDFYGMTLRNVDPTDGWIVYLHQTSGFSEGWIHSSVGDCDLDHDFSYSGGWNRGCKFSSSTCHVAAL